MTISVQRISVPVVFKALVASGGLKMGQAVEIPHF
jgi:hypothetical protein